MARMRRINIVIDPDLDDRLEREAAARDTSKSAVVRECVEHGLPAVPFDNGLPDAAERSPAVRRRRAGRDIDEYLYGPLGQDA